MKKVLRQNALWRERRERHERASLTGVRDKKIRDKKSKEGTERVSDRNEGKRQEDTKI